MRVPTVFLLALAIGAASASPTRPGGGRGRGHQLHAPRVSGAYSHRGQASHDTQIQFTMNLKGENIDQLEARMLQIAQSQGDWLSDDELTYYTAPAAADLANVQSFLASAGIPASAISYSRSQNAVTVSSTAGVINSLFQTTLQNFDYNGMTVQRANNLTLPDSLGAVVQDVSPLMSFGNPQLPAPARALQARGKWGRPGPQPQPHPAPSSSSTTSSATPSASSAAAAPTGGSTSGAVPASCNFNSVTIQCLRDLYGLSSYTPSPVYNFFDTAVLGFLGQSVSQTDLTNFLRTFRPQAAGYSLKVVNALGGYNNRYNPGVEAMLDVETVVGATWPLNTKYINMNPNGDIFQQGMQYMINAFTNSNRPKVVSVSYGSVESGYTPAQFNLMCQTAQQLTALGTTVVFASGDNGVDQVQGPGGSCTSGFQPTYPSGCPYILSVGATVGASPSISAVSRFSSGAGFSNLASTPSWQQSAVSGYLAQLPSTTLPYLNSTGRGFADVSAQGDLYNVVVGGQTMLVGGTSASAPLIASLIAYLNDARRKAGRGSVGWIHSNIYANPQAFTDVASGQSCGCPDVSACLPSVAGWDAATGLGNPTLAGLRSIYNV